MRNISDFGNVPKERVVVGGQWFESNEVDFEVDAGQDREPIETTNHLCDAGIHMGFGYRV